MYRVVGDRAIVETEGEHPHEVHRPDAHPHRDGARQEPGQARATGRGDHPARKHERDIARERSDQHRHRDKCRAIGAGKGGQVWEMCHAKVLRKGPAANCSPVGLPRTLNLLNATVLVPVSIQMGWRSDPCPRRGTQSQVRTRENTKVMKSSRGEPSFSTFMRRIAPSNELSRKPVSTRGSTSLEISPAFCPSRTQPSICRDQAAKFELSRSRMGRL